MKTLICGLKMSKYSRESSNHLNQTKIWFEWIRLHKMAYDINKVKLTCEGRMENPEIRIRNWNRNPEPESGTGTGTGTGEINEWFKLGSMININTPPFSAFLARWMTIR